MNSKEQASVFLFELVPASAVDAGELEGRLRSRASSFTPAARPRLSPALFAHRILRRGEGRGYAWEITFWGFDAAESDGEGEAPFSESLADAIEAEVRDRLADLAQIGAAAAYEDISPLPIEELIDAPTSAITSFADGEPMRWEDYARDAKTETAGEALPDEILAAVEKGRAEMPAQPDLKPYKAGYIYFGNSDKGHIAYVKQYLAERASSAGPADRRKVLAFSAFQGREGSTSAINTYDSQLVTWGTGWGGLGGMGQVMQRAVRSPAVRDLFSRCGLRHRGLNNYDIVDLASKKVVTGSRDALLVMQASKPLLYMLINAATSQATRQAVTDAQLQTFMNGSGDITSADQIATQALFNLVAHLRHWAPAFASGAVEWAAPRAGEGPPSEARDKKLAVQIGRYFYGKARKTKWLPDWKQFQLYWEHMKKDGLDCMDDPFIKASGPPAEDPFASGTATATESGSTTKAAPAGELLKNPPLKGSSELDAVARGELALKRGSKCDAVKTLQQALIDLGFAVQGGADGDFGGATEGAVKTFQGKHSLGADGVVGKATLSAIDAALGARRSASA